jgi:PGF-pre-PGF domain-containing protein
MNRRVVLAFLAVLLITAPVIAFEDFKLSGSESVDALRCIQTKQALFISNTGDETSAYNVEISGAAAQWAEAVPGRFLLEPGQTSAVNVTLDTPCDASGSAELNTLFITDNGLEQSITQTVNVGVMQDIDLTPIVYSASVKPCEPTTFKVGLNNTAPFAETYDIKVINPSKIALNIQQKEKSVYLLNNETRTLSIDVIPTDCSQSGTAALTLQVNTKVTELQAELDLALTIRPEGMAALSMREDRILTDYRPSTASVEITNKGVIKSTYDISVTGAPWAKANISMIDLFPDETKSIPLILTPPRGTAPMGEYHLNVSAKTGKAAYSIDVPVRIYEPSWLKQQFTDHLGRTLLVCIAIIAGIILIVAIIIWLFDYYSSEEYKRSREERAKRRAEKAKLKEKLKAEKAKLKAKRKADKIKLKEKRKAEKAKKKADKAKLKAQRKAEKAKLRAQRKSEKAKRKAEKIRLKAQRKSEKAKRKAEKIRLKAQRKADKAHEREKRKADKIKLKEQRKAEKEHARLLKEKERQKEIDTKQREQEALDRDRMKAVAALDKERQKELDRKKREQEAIESQRRKELERMKREEERRQGKEFFAAATLAAERELRKNNVIVPKRTLEGKDPRYTIWWLALLLVILAVAAIVTWNYVPFLVDYTEQILVGIGCALIIIVILIFIELSMGQRQRVYRLKIIKPKKLALQTRWKTGIGEIGLTVNQVLSKVIVRVWRGNKPTQFVAHDDAVLEYFGVEGKGMVDDDVDSIDLRFAVPKRWLDKRLIDPARVKLARFKDNWKQVETELVSEDKDNYYYSAEVDSFGHFAIVGKEGSLKPKEPPVKLPWPLILAVLVLIIVIGGAYALSTFTPAPYVPQLPAEEVNGIPAQYWPVNTQHTLNISKAFIDPDNETLAITYTPVQDMVVTVKDGLVTFMPKKDFVGERNITFVATDSEGGKASSNAVPLIVYNPPPMTMMQQIGSYAKDYLVYIIVAVCVLVALILAIEYRAPLKKFLDED